MKYLLNAFTFILFLLVVVFFKKHTDAEWVVIVLLSMIVHRLYIHESN